MCGHQARSCNATLVAYPWPACLGTGDGKRQRWQKAIILASWALNYSQGFSYDRDLVSMMCINQVGGEELGKLIGEDLPLFNDVGVAALSEEQRRHLRARYEPRVENPFCREIVTWLNGGYEFDPACLTD